MAAIAAPSHRLDKWLWHARVTKSRTGAQTLISTGQVRVNRVRALRASHELRLGDIITIATGARVKVVKVCGFAVRRGPACEAALLFEDLAPPAAIDKADI